TERPALHVGRGIPRLSARSTAVPTWLWRRGVLRARRVAPEFLQGGHPAGQTDRGGRRCLFPAQPRNGPPPFHPRLSATGRADVSPPFGSAGSAREEIRRRLRRA